MHPILVVAKKEMRQIAKNRSLIVGIVLFMGVFGGHDLLGAIMAVVDGDAKSIVSTLDSLMMYLVLVLGVFSGYFFSSQAFLGGKRLKGPLKRCSVPPLCRCGTSGWEK
ncbi:hypothetical protein [Methanogenium cariaci]|uniref:hypothetical protein n=1 Tax=Methanogenium cariaci TaxID=2197 RepID=UPI0007847262|nr:hypothetical protein [Methanogenium cariaci]